MKKKKLLLLMLMPLFISVAFADTFPVKEWTSPGNNNPLIFYLSGDGGLNNFSTTLCESLSKKGYDVIALNSKSYFWDRKTPEQTTTDITSCLNSKLQGRKNQQIVLIGYSFGADVVPFILNRLPKNLDDKIIVSYLMASSGSTDFEIHWEDIFGGNAKRSMDVVTELNKLGDDKIVLISGSGDHTLVLDKITLKKYTHEVLPGGHHFDGNINEIVSVILNNMK
ncbi:MAG: AcvB/VirJ family lysyl-phosphatidylglycerol hydrolase [Ginsengibacter sp.]